MLEFMKSKSKKKLAEAAALLTATKADLQVVTENYNRVVKEQKHENLNGEVLMLIRKSCSEVGYECEFVDDTVDGVIAELKHLRALVATIHEATKE